MSAQEAFVEFVKHVLVPAKAARFAAIAETKKGKQRILDGLCHELGPAIRADSVRHSSYDVIWNSPCYVFHSPLGFGVEFTSVREAYDALSGNDGWLILLRDASAAIYRPEAKWDDERLIAGVTKGID
jgi:hypothetical protein